MKAMMLSCVNVKCSTDSGTPKIDMIDIDMSPLRLVISGHIPTRIVVTSFGKLPLLSCDNSVNNCNALYFVHVGSYKDYPVIWKQLVDQLSFG